MPHSSSQARPSVQEPTPPSLLSRTSLSLPPSFGSHELGTQLGLVARSNLTRRKSGACLRCAVVGSMSRRNATRIVSVYFLVFHTVDCFLRTLSFAFPSAPFGVTDTPVIAHPYDMPPRQPFFISDGFWCHSWLVLAQFASIFISFLLTQITPRHDNTTYTFPSATELIPPGFHRYTSSLPISAHQSLAPIIRISRLVFSPFLRYYSHPIFTRLQCLTLHCVVLLKPDQSSTCLVNGHARIGVAMV